jgi:hypothetical protein
MTAFWDSIPAHLEPEQMIDEERWADVRRTAKAFLDTLSE